jgi:glycerol-3-phosphate dehydrogenase
VSAPDCDLAVVGAGIHGAGVAQAAAAAGYSVLLLEREEQPARWTSSRSSKLIHGGLRYLESGQFGLVRECLRERTLLLRNAPSLVRLIPFHIPAYQESSRKPATLRLGLGLYALLGGLHRHNRYSALPSREWDRLDGLRLQGLRAVYRYLDGQTDDAALTRAVVESAVEHGARLRTGTEVERIQLDDTAQTLHCRSADGRFRVSARVVINAAGPWVGALQARVEPATPALPMEWVAGTHLVLEGRLAQGAYYVEAPADARPVFVLPWGERTLLGTTERRYPGPPETIAPSREEQEYLLEAYRHYFPRRTARVLDAFAGLRVLPLDEGEASGRSRETRLAVDDPGRVRILSIYGGKLTAYRATAEQVLKRLAFALPRRGDITASRTLPLRAHS